MMKLLQFGMRNHRSKNPLIRLSANICLCITRKWADRTEKKLNQKWKKVPGWTPQKEEEMKKRILDASQRMEAFHEKVSSPERTAGKRPKSDCSSHRKACKAARRKRTLLAGRDHRKRGRAYRKKASAHCRMMRGEKPCTGSKCCCGKRGRR